MDIAARELGLDPVGVELDAWAVATRRAVGLRTLHADVETLEPRMFSNVVGLIASAPCQGFSTAGKQDPNDPRNRLVWEARRWIEALRPQWIAFEQVPPVLPIWRAYAQWLALLGYYTSEPGATRELQFNPTPGRFEGCVPMSRIGRAWSV